MNLGGTVGIAIAGSIFTNRLDSILGTELATLASNDPAGIRKLPNADAVIAALSLSLGTVYYFTIPVAAAIIFISLGKLRS